RTTTLTLLPPFSSVFFPGPPPPVLYALSLHDALPISFELLPFCRIAHLTVIDQADQRMLRLRQFAKGMEVSDGVEVECLVHHAKFTCFPCMTPYLPMIKRKIQ